MWSNDDFERPGVSNRSTTELLQGHLPISSGSLTALAGRPAKHKIYIHINSTNPVLWESGPERQRLEELGIQVATGGIAISIMTTQAWSTDEFLTRLCRVGSQNYHHLHPFYIRMNAGELNKDEIQLWVANLFYYQKNIPLKDAAILANCPLPEVRRTWVKRITDRDGTFEQEGGIEKWIRLGMACGLTSEALMDERHVRPSVRFAVDAYLNFARTRPWPIAIASSLTELFAPDLMAKRLDAFQNYYIWIASDGLDYFRARLTQAREDSEFALEVTLKYCDDLKMQTAAINALCFKCDVLWSMLDGLMLTKNEGLR